MKEFPVWLTLCITCGPGWRGPGGDLFQINCQPRRSIRLVGRHLRQGRDRPDRQLQNVVRHPSSKLPFAWLRATLPRIDAARLARADTPVAPECDADWKTREFCTSLDPIRENARRERAPRRFRRGRAMFRMRSRICPARRPCKSHRLMLVHHSPTVRITTAANTPFLGSD